MKFLEICTCTIITLKLNIYGKLTLKYCIKIQVRLKTNITNTKKHKSKYLCFFFSNKLLPKNKPSSLKNNNIFLKSTCIPPWVCQYRICKDNLIKTRD